MTSLQICLIISCSLCLYSASAQEKPRVTTKQGVVVGDKSADGNYYAFYGIPYAGNPSGVKRFKAPTPAPNFPGEFHAVDSSIRCAQPSSEGLLGTEDCLTISVFSKNLSASSPVIVWLEGESFTETKPFPKSYRGLVELSNVVVSINYRLSIFGFLCLRVEDAPGNAGLKDVIAGLKWIQDNIAGFGGDKNNIVLFGHGTSAAVADLISLSPASNGLIHKAIVSSGSALAPWAVSYSPVESAQAVGRELQYTGKNNEQLAKALIGTEINVLIYATRDFIVQKNSSLLFAPCIEDSKFNDTVLTEVPINTLRSGNYSHIPFLTGYVDKEGTVRAYQAIYSDWFNKMENNFTDFVQVDLGFSSLQNKTNVGQKIKEHYFGNAPLDMAAIEDYLEYFGDTMFLVSIIRGAWERALTSSQPVRLYEFSYRGTKNTDWAFNFPLTGAQHGVLLNYIFDYNLNPADKTVQDSLLRRWSAFAFNGSPVINIPTNDEWSPITKEGFDYLLITGEGVSNATTREQLGRNPHTLRMTFWNDIYNQYYIPPGASSSSKVISLSSFLILCQVTIKLF